MVFVALNTSEEIKFDEKQCISIALMLRASNVEHAGHGLSDDRVVNTIKWTRKAVS